MITAYRLFDYTGFHKNSRSRWLQKHFGLKSKGAKCLQIPKVNTAVTILIHSKVRINDELLTKLRAEINDSSTDLTKLMLTSPDQMKNTLRKIGVKPDVKIVEEDPEFTLFTKSCNNCMYFLNCSCTCVLKCDDFHFWIPKLSKHENFIVDSPKKEFIPEITKDDYEILKNSFDDLLEMYRGLEQRLLIIEKRTELPERSYRNEIIALINEIAHKQNQDQQSLYKSIYKAFDHSLNISEHTKHKDLKISYLEWYDKNGYLPKLLNFIRKEFKV